MRAMPGLIKDRHGTYYAQRKVPERLQEAVARVLNSEKPKQVFLKKSLGTKVFKEANVAATLVLADFNRTLASAEALLIERPVVPSLTDALIKRMAEFYYASLLAVDEEERQEGTGSEPIFQSVAAQLTAAGIAFNTPFKVGELPEAGLSDREVFKREHALAEDLPDAMLALAKGDITHVRLSVEELLEEFQQNLDPKSHSYRRLGMAVLGARVKALKDIERRNAGELVETPALANGPVAAPGSGGTLRNAVEGWEKERARPPGTVHEYRRAVEMFIQLHGDLAVADIKKRHAREYRDALQLVPSVRRGAMRAATLPTLSDWGRQNSEAPKVSAGTVNKQLGAVQAIVGWAHHNGVIPDDVPWSDPFQKMRVEEEQSGRGPFAINELQAIFDAPLFTHQESPTGAKGAAGVWLPLLALFNGARQGELAGLKASNIGQDANTPLLFIVADRKAGKRVKTKVSERVIPVHPLLVRLGFLDYVEERRRQGEHAWLFPTVAPDQGRALSAWSKWFGRYLRTTVGIKDTDRVFHSFRHGVKDALRRGRVDVEAREALLGHSGSTSAVSRGYGASEMLERWGVKVLRDAVAKIEYVGLDLSKVKTGHDTRARAVRKR
ncbi:site-specific integrase [Bradyrhizobium japonicum USDA 135]|nr:site-specific integrase [Bradyrhizobium japonicum USDA 135]